MKKTVLLLILIPFLTNSCRKNNRVENGFYCLSSYLTYSDTIKRTEQILRASSVVIYISNDSLSFWGDISFWGQKSTIKRIKNNDTLYVGELYKFFPLENNKLGCIYDFDKSSTEYFTYEKIDNNDIKIDKRFTFEPNDENKPLSKLIIRKRRNNIFTGNYLGKKQKIQIQEDGKVIGLIYFQKYTPYFAGGTCFPFGGNNLIRTNNGIWDCKINGKTYIFTKYSDKYIGEGTIPLSKTKFEIIKY